MKKLACLILSLLMLICTIGCNTKSIEMTLNDGVLENDFFSIDVSAYKDLWVGEEETNKAVDLAHACFDLENDNYNHYIIVQGKKGTGNFPNEQYFYDKMVTQDSRVVSGVITRFDALSDDLENSIFATIERQMQDGTTYYYTNIIFEDGGYYFSIHFYDQGDNTQDAAYTDAVNSFKLK